MASLDQSLKTRYTLSMPKSPEQPPLPSPADEFDELTRLTQRRRQLIEEAAASASPTDFDQALTEAERMLPDLIRRREAIKEKLWPFAELAKERLEEQYNENIATFEIAKVFEPGTREIKGIDRNLYAVPSFAEVVEALRDMREIVEQKVKQGLTRIQLTPIAMPQDELRARFKARLLAHYVDMPDLADATKRIPDPTKTKLFATTEKSSDPKVPLALDTSDPLFTANEYEAADVNGTVVYYPKRFDPQNHGGKTKAEVIAEVGGWQIILTEDNPILAAKNRGTTKHARKQLEAGKNSNEYLELLNTDPQYFHESGFTTEDWLTYALILLETKNQVLDDWQGKGKISRNTGQYFPARGYVPLAHFYRDSRRAYLYWDVPAFAGDHVSARSAVRVRRKKP